MASSVGGEFVYASWLPTWEKQHGARYGLRILFFPCFPFRRLPPFDRLVKNFNSTRAKVESLSGRISKTDSRTDGIERWTFENILFLFFCSVLTYAHMVCVNGEWYIEFRKRTRAWLYIEVLRTFEVGCKCSAERGGRNRETRQRKRGRRGIERNWKGREGEMGKRMRERTDDNSTMFLFLWAFT